MPLHMDDLSPEARRRLAERNPAPVARALAPTRERTTRKELPDTDDGTVCYRCASCGATFTSYRATTKPSPTCRHPRIEGIIRTQADTRQA